jgi:hypothetical protein
MVLLLAARWLYFHAPLPNTYYAKTGGGLLQLRAGFDYAAANWGLWLPGLLAAPMAVRRDRRYLSLALVALALTLSVILEGGDQFGLARFLLTDPYELISTNEYKLLINGEKRIL